jgi:hypothetical protein
MWTFAENYHLDKEKVVRDNKNDTRHVNFCRKLSLGQRKGRKGQWEWHKACELVKVSPCKFNFFVKTCFASRVILLHKSLGGFKHVITLHYGKQQLLALQDHVLNLQVWVVSQIVVNTLRLVVQQCVLNQSWRYWFLLDVVAINISFVCQMWLDCLTPHSNETQDFDGNTCKSKWYKS